MSLSPVALEALRAAQSAFTESEADVFEDALARGLEAVDREGRLVGAFQAQELERLELAAVDGRVSASCEDPGHPTWLRTPDDVRGCPWCRVAELEQERHSTNEALDDVVRELRRRENRPAAADTLAVMPVVSPVPVEVREQVAEWRARLAERGSLEDPHDGPLAHRYLLGHDLPGAGGQR